MASSRRRVFVLVIILLAVLNVLFLGPRTLRRFRDRGPDTYPNRTLTDAALAALLHSPISAHCHDGPAFPIGLPWYASAESTVHFNSSSAGTGATARRSAGSSENRQSRSCSRDHVKTVVAPQQHRVLHHKLGPRYLDYGAFNASRRNLPTFSFYRAESPSAIPPPCPYIAKASADLQTLDASGNVKVMRPPVGGCWRHACTRGLNVPVPCFGGCRCPIGPCRIVSVFTRTSPTTDVESLRCVDSSEFFLDPAAPYDEAFGVAPFLRPKVRVERRDRQERKPDLKPLVCPSDTAPPDPAPTWPTWPQLPPNATVAELATRDHWLRKMIRVREGAARRGSRTYAREVTEHIANRIEELRSAGSVPPPYDPTMTHAEKLAVFQRATAWRSAFPKWKRWSGKCAAPEHRGFLRGYHSHQHGFYRIDNVCVGTGLGQPVLSGYRPRMQQFEGTDEHKIPPEVWSPFFDNYVEKYTVPMLEKLTALDATVSSPDDECFLDTNTVLYPLNYGVHNHGHQIRTFGTAANAISEWFPNATDDPLVIYPETTDRPAKAVDLFAPLLSKYAAHIFSEPLWKDEAAMYEDKQTVRPPIIPPTSRVCFKSVVIPHVCRRNGPQDNPCHYHDPHAPVQGPDPNGRHYPESWDKDDVAMLRELRLPPQQPRSKRSTTKRPDDAMAHGDGHESGTTAPTAGAPPSMAENGKPVKFSLSFPISPRTFEPVPWLTLGGQNATHFVPRGNQHRFLLHGRRGPSDVAAVKLIRSRIAQCLGVPLRTKARTTKPHVVYAPRSMSRGDTLSTRLGDIAQIAADRGAGRFTVIETGHSDPVPYLRVYMDADVLYGPYGSGLGWLFLMPPESVVVLSNMVGQNVTHWLAPVAFQQTLTERWRELPNTTYFDYYGDSVLSRTSLLVLPAAVPDWITTAMHMVQMPPLDLPRAMDAAFCGLRVGYLAAPSKCPVPVAHPYVDLDVYVKREVT